MRTHCMFRQRLVVPPIASKCMNTATLIWCAWETVYNEAMIVPRKVMDGCSVTRFEISEWPLSKALEISLSKKGSNGRTDCDDLGIKQVYYHKAPSQQIEFRLISRIRIYRRWRLSIRLPYPRSIPGQYYG
jgi:hypothetical protein